MTPLQATSSQAGAATADDEASMTQVTAVPDSAADSAAYSAAYSAVDPAVSAEPLAAQGSIDASYDYLAQFAEAMDERVEEQGGGKGEEATPFEGEDAHMVESEESLAEVARRGDLAVDLAGDSAGDSAGEPELSVSARPATGAEEGARPSVAAAGAAMASGAVSVQDEVETTLKTAQKAPERRGGSLSAEMAPAAAAVETTTSTETTARLELKEKKATKTMAAKTAAANATATDPNAYLALPNADPTVAAAAKRRAGHLLQNGTLPQRPRRSAPSRSACDSPFPVVVSPRRLLIEGGANGAMGPDGGERAGGQGDRGPAAGGGRCRGRSAGRGGTEGSQDRASTGGGTGCAAAAGTGSNGEGSHGRSNGDDALESDTEALSDTPPALAPSDLTAASPPSPGSWVCMTCTLINLKTSFRCTVCNFKKPPLPFSVRSARGSGRGGQTGGCQTPEERSDRASFPASDSSPRSPSALHPPSAIADPPYRIRRRGAAERAAPPARAKGGLKVMAALETRIAEWMPTPIQQHLDHVLEEELQHVGAKRFLRISDPSG